ncbi:ThuA domain-containing protein [Pararhizobium sp. IMCC21322]|uniref:ThuA domain-containing protein n=1 Tax=Pararhizobium sp. IMCC21322 TaxID=3067903 RepID=UPI0027407483|nr:ThuA domain-containing protein [Pararhizobium sp. IMCC21322]
MSNKKAIIVWGGWEGHTPEASANVVKDMLEAQNFDVVLDSSTEAFADPKLGEFDLIIPAVTMSRIEKEELQNLLACIRAGSGIAGFHGLMCDSFRNEPDYQFMTGGQWVAHPGDIIDYRVEITKSDDPIVAGIGDFDYRSEQYYMHFDPSIEVLATTRFDGTYFEEIDGVVMPVVWKRTYGKGRVFYSSLGHVADEFKVPQMRSIFERGALWAAR